MVPGHPSAYRPRLRRALADNQHQGIVPVPARLGNGEDPDHNLYWGSAYGVKTFFARSADWVRSVAVRSPEPEVLERSVFKHRKTNTYMVADAYRGSEIREAVLDFFDAAAGASPETIVAPPSAVRLTIRGGSNLVAYVGHDGLMDFSLPIIPKKKNEIHRDTIILACVSKQYFADVLRGGRCLSSLVDDQSDGSRGVHSEIRARRLDWRRE